jgi:hypothetical protein
MVITRGAPPAEVPPPFLYAHRLKTALAPLSASCAGVAASSEEPVALLLHASSKGAETSADAWQVSTMVALSWDIVMYAF